MKTFQAKGKILKRCSLNHSFGGEFYNYKVKLDDGGIAYVMDDQFYEEELDMIRGIKSSAIFERNSRIGSLVSVDYIEWKGKKVIVSIDFAPGFVDGDLKS